jgi:hypothetical protein
MQPINYALARLPRGVENLVNTKCGREPTVPATPIETAEVGTFRDAPRPATASARHNLFQRRRRKSAARL